MSWSVWLKSSVQQSKVHVSCVTMQLGRSSVEGCSVIEDWWRHVERHHTATILFPSLDGSWQILVAIVGLEWHPCKKTTHRQARSASRHASLVVQVWLSLTESQTPRVRPVTPLVKKLMQPQFCIASYEKIWWRFSFCLLLAQTLFTCLPTSCQNPKKCVPLANSVFFEISSLVTRLPTGYTMWLIVSTDVLCIEVCGVQ